MAGPALAALHAVVDGKQDVCAGDCRRQRAVVFLESRCAKHYFFGYLVQNKPDQGNKSRDVRSLQGHVGRALLEVRMETAREGGST